VELFIHTHVREDDLSLYGFMSSKERDLFRTLLRVPGVGPKLALAILSVFDPPTLVDCVANRDIARFKTVPGVGAKTAEKILIELKSKLKVEDWGPGVALASPPVSLGQGLWGDLTTALLQLGYRAQEISSTLQQLATSEGAGVDPSALLSKAVRILSQNAVRRVHVEHPERRQP
jgi:Holliday junction DNA helicase RuvA